MIETNGERRVQHLWWFPLHKALNVVRQQATKDAFDAYQQQQAGQSETSRTESTLGSAGDRATKVEEGTEGDVGGGRKQEPPEGDPACGFEVSVEPSTSFPLLTTATGAAPASETKGDAHTCAPSEKAQADERVQPCFKHFVFGKCERTAEEGDCPFSHDAFTTPEEARSFIGAHEQELRKIQSDGGAEGKWWEPLMLSFRATGYARVTAREEYKCRTGPLPLPRERTKKAKAKSQDCEAASRGTKRSRSPEKSPTRGDDMEEGLHVETRKEARVTTAGAISFRPRSPSITPPPLPP